MQHTNWRSSIHRDWTRRPRIALDLRSDEGAATAEYAITIMATIEAGMHSA